MTLGELKDFLDNLGADDKQITLEIGEEVIPLDEIKVGLNPDGDYILYIL